LCKIPIQGHVNQEVLGLPQIASCLKGTVGAYHPHRYEIIGLLAQIFRPFSHAMHPDRIFRIGKSDVTIEIFAMLQFTQHTLAREKIWDGLMLDLTEMILESAGFIPRKGWTIG
jgi:hypothetical protein